MALTVKKEERPNAEVALIGVLAASAVEAEYETALQEATKHVAVPGFRKGHVPQERIIEEVGENFLWKDAAERALKNELDELLKKENVVPIIPLSLSFKSVDVKKDVEFEIVAVTAPACSIDDYKSVAERALEALVHDDAKKEQEEAVKAFRTQTRAIIKMQKPDEVKEGDAEENEGKALTPISDDEAKQVGFENGDAAEFFIKGEAEKAVKDRAEQKKRSAVAEALLKGATCAIPRILIQEEAGGMMETFKKDVAAQGLQWSDYLKRVGKTESQVKDDLAPNAEKRIALDLIFGHIIREEKLEFTEEDKKKEEEFAHKLVDQGVPHDNAHRYARESLMRERVWESLGIRG